MAIEDTKERQLEIASRLQLKLLERWEKLLNGTSDADLTPTEAATIAKVLQANGWSIDPAKLPTGIKDKMLAGSDPTEFKEGDADILPIRRTK